MATIKDRYILDIDTRGATANLGKLKGALIAVGGAVVTKQILDVTATFEDLRDSLNVVTGSADKGGAALERIKDFARTSQFGVEELSKSFIQLKAAGIEPTEKLLRTFTDTAAVTTDQLGSLEAITALLSRTTGGGLGLEELERLADRGIPVYRILQEEIGITRKEISEFGQTAEGARKLVDALLTGLDREFGGATQERLDNLSTVMSNFQIALKEVANEFGTGISPAVKEITQNITDFLDANKGLARTIGETLGNVLLAISRQIGKLLEQMASLTGSGLQNFSAELLEGLASFIQGFGSTIDGFVDAIFGLQNTINKTLESISQIPGIGFDVIVKPANETVDEFVVRTQAKMDELRDKISDAPIFSFSEPTKRDLADEVMRLYNQLQDISKDDGSIIFLNEIEQGFNGVTTAVGPAVDSLRESAAAIREAAAAAKLNEEFPKYDDAIARIARAQEAAAKANQTFADSFPEQEVNVVAETYKTLEDTIKNLNQRYLDSLPAVEQNTARYNEVRETIAKLNSQLKENTDLTATQRQEIENSIATLNAEKNTLYERIKSGEYLYEILENTSKAIKDNREQREQLVSAIAQLEFQQKSEIYNNETTQAQLVALKAALAANSEEYDTLTGKVEAQNQALSSSVQFYRDLIESAGASATEQTNAMLAQKQLNEDLEKGRITLDQYAFAQERLNQLLGVASERTQTYADYVEQIRKRVEDNIRTDEYKNRLLEELTQQYGDAANATGVYAEYLELLNGKTKETVDQHEKLKEAIEKTNQSTQDRIKAAQDESMLDNLRGIERELKSIELQELRTAAAAKKRIQEQFAGKLSSAELNSALSEIDAATTRSIELQQELAMETYKNQRTFATGWRNAFEEYREAATDNSKLAADVFNRFTRGMEDSIVEFARTGKFSMKDFLADIAEMILRSQVQRLIAQIFGGTNLFGLGGRSNFAGGFANGGTIPSGQFGIVGENGPEFISGPANITPMGGSNMVTYNINAVDAPSFQQLVARDPGFIHAVSEQGRRAIPAGRR